VTNLFSAPSSTFTPLGAEKTWERVFYMWNNKLTGNKNLSREKILMIVTYGFFAFVNMFFFTDIIRQSTIRKYDLFAINSPVLYPFVIGVLMDYICKKEHINKCEKTVFYSYPQVPGLVFLPGL
jgi:hypothetical protein